MNSAGREWEAWIAARNAVETARALKYAGRGQIVDGRTGLLVSPRAAVALCNQLALNKEGGAA